MNINKLRKNYDGLTMLERLALADNAEGRDDEPEIRAINAASPKESLRQVDFYDLMREITTLRLCNLIVRLSYIIQFDFFSMHSEFELLKEKPDLEREERLFNNARMVAFLFIRTKDSWQTVNDELGLRPNYDKEISEFLFSFETLKEKEDLMRAMAFTEEEAKEFNKKLNGKGKICTLEEEIKSIKEVLGLSE